MESVPAAKVAIVPLNPLNEYVMVCVNALDAVVTESVAADPIVRVGMVNVDEEGDAVTLNEAVPVFPTESVILPETVYAVAALVLVK